MTYAGDILTAVADRWWFYVFHATWQSGLLGALLLVLVLALRRQSASLRYGILVLALLKFAVPPMLAFPTGLFSIAAITTEQEASAADAFGAASLASDAVFEPEGLSGTSVAPAVQGQPRPAAPTPMTALAEGEHPGITQASHAIQSAAGLRGGAPGMHAESATRDAPANGLTWRTGLLGLHLAGVLAVALWILRSWLEMRRLIRACRPVADPGLQHLFADLCQRLGFRRQMSLLIAPHSVPPMGFGILRPVVVVSEALVNHLNAEETTLVLAHELAHHRRRDTWLVLLEDALLLAWWFNPVLWLLVREVRRVREDCCDDCVLAMDIGGRGRYCDTLVNAARCVGSPRPAHVAFGFADRLHPLGWRLKRIMDTTLRRSPRLTLAGGIILLATGLAVLPGVSHVQVEARGEAPSAEPEEAPGGAQSKVDEEISAHYGKADADVQKYIRWTAERFGPAGLWLAADAFAETSPKDREKKIERCVEVFDGSKYGRHLCPCLAQAGALQDERLVPGLIRVATYQREDGRYDCRPKWMAVAALGRQDDVSAVPALIPLLDHGNQNTRIWAQASLARLTGQNFGTDKEAWGTWWDESGHEATIDLDQLKPWDAPEEAAEESPASSTTVTGRILDVDGNPIEGARLAIKSWQSGPNHHDETTSDAEGRFSLDALPSNSRLFVFADGYASMFRTHDVTEGVNAHWDFTLPKSAHVSGQIIDTKGKACPGLVIELWTVNSGPAPAPGVSYWASGGEGQDKADDTGAFDMPNVAPGKHRVVVYRRSPLGGDRSMQQIPLEGRFLEVESGQRVDDFTILVNSPEDFAIAGHVRDAAGNAVPGIIVDTFIPHGRHWWTKTDATGAFYIDGLDGVGLSAVKLNFNGVDGAESYKLAIPSVPVNTKDLVFVIPGKGTIQGTVRDAKTGALVADYEVTVPTLNLPDSGAVWDEPGVHVERSEDGAFTLSNVPAGEALVEVRAPGLGAQRFTVAVAPDAVTPLDCQMAGPAVFAGQVTQDGEPRKTTIVVNGEWLGTDDQGEFSFQGYPNGPLLAWFFMRDGWHRTVRVDLESGKTTRQDLDVGGSCEVSGHVTFPDDEEDFCTIRLAAKPAPDGWQESGRPGVEEYVLSYAHVRESGGEYHLRNVPPGHWYVMAGKYRPAMHRSILGNCREIDLKEGETLTLDFDLTAEGS